MSNSHTHFEFHFILLLSFCTGDLPRWHSPHSSRLPTPRLSRNVNRLTTLQVMFGVDLLHCKVTFMKEYSKGLDLESLQGVVIQMGHVL
jgi:hypothetical protein